MQTEKKKLALQTRDADCRAPPRPISTTLRPRAPPTPRRQALPTCARPSPTRPPTRLPTMADAAAAAGKTVAVADAETGGAAAPGTADAGFDVARGGWYTELSSMWPGMGMSLQVEEVLFKGRSGFQVRQLEGRGAGRVEREGGRSKGRRRPAA